MVTNEELIEHVARVAAQTAIEYIEKQREERQKNKVDRRLRNTKLLLTNYRSFKLHCLDVKNELDLVSDPELLENLDTDEFIVEAIKKSKARTLAMVRFIDRMLIIYKSICEASTRTDEARRYDTIHKLYISEEKFSAEMVATCHKIDPRTVHRDVNKAINTLSSLIFGVDSIRFDD